MLTNEEEENEDSMLEVIDATCNELRKTEEFCDEAMDFTANPKIRKALKLMIGARNSIQSISIATNVTV